MQGADSDRSRGFTVILPVYNEADALESVLSNLFTVLDKTNAEVIVVDDGSTDSTPEILKKYREIRILRHRSNRGYGAALKTGIRHARHETVVILDADGTYPLEAIWNLLERYRQGYDMVVGARTGRHVEMPRLRRWVKFSLALLARYVVGETLPDINSGFRVFKRSMALCFFDFLPDGFSFTTTITLAGLRNGYQVDFIPIDYHARIGRSKIRPIRDTLNFIQLILRIALYFAPMKIFLPIAGILLGLAISWGIFTKVVFGHLYDDSTMMIAMTAVQVAVLGLLAELINRRMSGYRAIHDEDVIEEQPRPMGQKERKT